MYNLLLTNSYKVTQFDVNNSKLLTSWNCEWNLWNENDLKCSLKEKIWIITQVYVASLVDKTGYSKEIALQNSFNCQYLWVTFLCYFKIIIGIQFVMEFLPFAI